MRDLVESQDGVIVGETYLPMEASTGALHKALGCRKK